MNEKKYYNQGIGLPPKTDEKYKQLLELAKQYHIRCDTYDKVICQNRKGIPQTGEQRKRIEGNARRVLRETRALANSLGFTGRELHHAIISQAKKKENEEN